LPTNLTKLILVPHDDLHRFPIHTFFLDNAALPNLQGCTYLPSIQIGLNLQSRSTPNKSYTPLLSVEDPETSALGLTDEPLTAKRISQLDLSSYNLITLAACETAITGNENINIEYVGLASAFLQAGAVNILSTLWQVDEIANAWFTIYFHQQLIAGKSPSIALNITQTWMQTATWQNLADWLTQLSELPHLGIGIVDRLKSRIENTRKEGGTIGLNRPTKYSHSYYWAAFTLTGEG
jgi:CHAT domain-containing protein